MTPLLAVDDRALGLGRRERPGRDYDSFAGGSSIT